MLSPLPISGAYTGSPYGSLHVFTLDAVPNQLPDWAADVLKAFQVSKSFGDVSERKPDLLAVIKNAHMEWHYFQLYRVMSDSFWALMYSMQSIGDGSFVRIPESVWLLHKILARDGLSGCTVGQTQINTSWGIHRFEYRSREDGAHELEMYNGWSEKDHKAGKGLVTFVQEIL